jgi:hypothetical protein
VATGKASILVPLVLGAVISAHAASAGPGTPTTGKIVLTGVSEQAISIVVSPASPTSGTVSTTVDISNVLSSAFSAQSINAGSASAPAAGTPVAASSGPAPVAVQPIVRTINVANVTLRSNPLKDYSYTTHVQSLNGKRVGMSTGVLKSNDAGNSNAVIYTVNFGGRNVTFNDGVGAGPEGTMKAGSGAVTLPVTITLHLSPFLQAGAYTDVLSFNRGSN